MKGTIVIREGKRGKRYHAVLTVNGNQKWKAFTKRRDAERYLAKVVSAVHDGAYQEVSPIVMNDLLDIWITQSLDVRLNQGLLKHSTSKSYKSMIEKHLRPAFGDIRTDQLTHKVLSGWERLKSEDIAQGELSRKSYNNLLNLLKSILSWARHPAQCYMAHDPLSGLKPLPLERVERDFLQPREIQELLGAAEPPDDTLIKVALYSGLRRGELFALQWGDVEWGEDGSGGKLHIRRATYQGRISSPKTHHSVRSVDVPQFVMDELSVFREMRQPKEEGYIFRTDSGTPIDPDNWSKRIFHPLLERAGLRKLGLHTLRHTYASILINAGESIKYVSNQLGHASIQITADLYGHLFDETGKAAMERLDKKIRKEADLQIPILTSSGGQ
jgi:integrase